jgi:hypothetical protein
VGDGVQQDFHLAKRFYDQAAEFDIEARLPRNIAIIMLKGHKYLQGIIGTEVTDKFILQLRDSVTWMLLYMQHLIDWIASNEKMSIEGLTEKVPKDKVVIRESVTEGSIDIIKDFTSVISEAFIHSDSGSALFESLYARVVHSSAIGAIEDVLNKYDTYILVALAVSFIAVYLFARYRIARRHMNRWR